MLRRRRTGVSTFGFERHKVPAEFLVSDEILFVEGSGCADTDMKMWSRKKTTATTRNTTITRIETLIQIQIKKSRREGKERLLRG